jgi:hypothetical protein
VITVVPGVIPVTIPKTGSVVATAELLLPHDPPMVALLKAAVNPAQICIDPVITPGIGFTVTIVAATQPVANP